MFIIGIAGGTGSGKTTVTRKIINQLGGHSIAEIPLDSYYKDSSHVPFSSRQMINFDHPDAFDWDLLRSHIRDLKAGRSIHQPVYVMVTSSRSPETVLVEPGEVLIIEGILALHDREIRDMMDLKVFVEAEADERLIRLIRRDVIERGRTAEAVMERYLRVLKPMHREFIEPTKAHADLIIPNGGDNKTAISFLREYILLRLDRGKTAKDSDRLLKPNDKE